jgi:peptide/nickel transport system substrate-binding protein
MAAAGERPTGTVTFLFSDIEGSTRLLQRLGDRYGQALAEHQQLLRAAFDEHGGHEIDTQGDSFFVAFRRAKDAVAAAVTGQRALAAHDWPDGAELRVRMGIHTGEPGGGEGRYVGLGVHRAARIGATAVGGQVLLSETTRSLLRDDPLPEVTLRDVGLRRLKDIDAPERLFEVDAPGLAAVGGPRTSRRRLIVGAAIVAVAVAAGLATFLSRGGGGTANAAREVEPNQVGIIDTKNGSISGAVGVGSAPNGVAAGDGAVWVANTDDNTVARVDNETRTLRQTIQVGGAPAGVAVSPRAVWVANAVDGTVSRIDPSSNTVVQNINVGNGPTAVAYGAKKVWVANSADGTVSQIDPIQGKVERTLPGAVGVTALTVAFGHVWGVAPTNGGVIELDPSGNLHNVAVGNDPHAITAAAGAIWVTNRQDGTVSKIDPRTDSITATVSVGHAPNAIAAGGSAVWVANGGDGTLSEIDPARNIVVKTLSLTNPPQGLASSGSELYVSVRSSGAANRGGTLHVDMGVGSPDFLDPAYAYSPTSWRVLSMTNDGLVGFRRVGGPGGAQLVPDLATAIPVPADGGRTYTFTLRQGIRYSNGHPVEPEDIKTAIERLLSASHPIPPTQGYFAADIAGASRCAPGKPCRLSGIVTDRSSRTITFHLTAPDPDFLMKLALPVAYAVPAGMSPSRRDTVPATGPYRIASYSAKDRVIELVRNSRFSEWSEDAQPSGFPAAIRITWPPDALPPEQVFSRLTSDVETGRTDVAIFPSSPPVPGQALDQLTTRYPNQVRLILEPATWYFFLNTRVPPFDDTRVRQAVATAFDRDTFGHLLTPEYTTTCNILPPGYSGYQRGCPYRGDALTRLEKGKALVRAAGKTGARIVVWTPEPVAVRSRYMVSLLDSLGFHASLHAVPASRIFEYFTSLFDPRKRVQTGYIGWSADYPSSLAFFQQQLSCAGVTGNPKTSTNVSEFCDHRIDAEIDHASQVQVVDPPRATLLWQKVERDLLAAAPMIPSYNGRAIVFLSKRTGNFQYHTQWGTLLDQLWVRQAGSG